MILAYSFQLPHDSGLMAGWSNSHTIARAALVDARPGTFRATECKRPIPNDSTDSAFFAALAGVIRSVRGTLPPFPGESR